MAESFLAEVVVEVEASADESPVAALYSWGWNEHGNLATGDKVDRA